MASCLLLILLSRGCDLEMSPSVASMVWFGSRLCGRCAGGSRAATRRGAFRSLDRLPGETFNLMRHRPFGIPVRAGIVIVVGAETLAHLHERKHAAHLDRPELSEARHHR